MDWPAEWREAASLGDMRVRLSAAQTAAMVRELEAVVERYLNTGQNSERAVLLLVDRGLRVGQIGLVIATRGVVVLALELPTGGLADLFGRRACR